MTRRDNPEVDARIFTQGVKDTFHIRLTVRHIEHVRFDDNERENCDV